MVKDTQRRIEEYKALLPGVKERIAAVALMLVVSIVMMASASYAWVTISRAPEVKGMSTTLAGNGNLEIALVNPEGTAPGNATGTETSLLSSNITWGNLINLSDSGYGLDQIALRPALLSGYNRNSTPLYGASYDESGRVTSTSQTYTYATWKQAEDGSWFFDAAKPTYGVRAIASVTYENITGNAAANKLMQNAKDTYGKARALYLSVIDNEYLISSPGVFPEVKSMDALAALLRVYVQDQADYFTARLNDTTASYVTADYSGVVTYTYRLALAFQEVMELEGEALLYLANLQAYLNGAESTASFGSVASLLAEYKAGTLTAKGVQLDSLATFSQDYSEIAKAVNGLKPYADACDPDKVANPERVEWSKIGTYVNYLVDINSTTLAKTRTSQSFTIGSIKSLGSDDLDTMMDLLDILQSCTSEKNAADVVVYKGIIARLEQRLPESTTYTLEGNETIVKIPLNVHARVAIIKIDITEDEPVFASVRTTAAEPFISTNDEGRTANMENSGGNKGDAVANDTYGMAIDMWVRTNVSDVVLTLEGSLVTELQPEFAVDQKGNKVALYTITYDGEQTEAYFMVDDQGVAGWYEASGHTLIGTEDQIGSLDENGKPTNMQAGYTIEAKQVEVVIGYDGVNRVWEDYLDLIEAGLMEENNTTQGAGSCYVFYADPSDQTRILHLLEAFTVVFVNSEGTTLGTAKLDTEHYFSINGKTTVPLQMVTGNTYYTDENGDQHLGILPLAKNEATWVTAIVYLDGQRLSNADVLAVGEIEGSLNIQFGSSVDLNNMDDEKLRFEYRDITATANSGGSTTTNSQQPISYEYDGNAKTVTVTLLVDGEQPRSISAFFTRFISKSQGTKCETVEFVSNGDKTWSATFDLTKPGTYSMRNLIVDGSYYPLYDGTNSADDVDNYPTIIIEGMGITSVYCMLPQGVTMTADSSVSAEVSVSINAAGDLMPKQVRALFRSTEGMEFSATLIYDERLGNWSGAANITESGTYTLLYLVIDGEYTEIDEELQTNHIIYLGLTAQVWSDGALLEDGTHATTFEYKGPTTVDVTMKLYDRSGVEITKQEDVWLYYHAEGSVLDQDGMYNRLYWNEDEGQYEGQLTLLNGGTFVFNRVVTNASSGNPSTVRKATVAPVFVAYVTDPPEYQGYTENEYQFVPNGGATMTVMLTNAQTATMWAEIKDLTTGDTYMVKLGTEEGTKVALDTDTNLYSFTFKVPTKNNKQDGNWQLMSLYMQGVANADEEWVPVTTGEGENPTAENSVYVDLEDEQIVSYVVQTVNISITDGNGNSYTGEVFGKEGNTVTGVFMQAYSSQNVTVTIKDWAGDAIRGEVAVTWLSTYKNDSATYGGYTGAYQNPPAITLTGGGTTYTLAAQTFQMAGSYTSRFTATIGDITMSITGPSFEVWSKLPTIAITAISPTGTMDVDNAGKAAGHTSGATPSFNATTATVYFKCARSGSGSSCDPYRHNYTRPSVTITISGMGNASQANLSFGSGVQIYNGTTQTDGYSWTGDGALSRNIGYYRSRTAADDDKTPAGTITANTLIFVYNGVEYSFAISTLTGVNAITINNPY